VSQDEKMAGYM